MKKIISIILLIGMVFMLEFNFLQTLFPGLFAWIESILAFAILAGILLWNKKTIDHEV